MIFKAEDRKREAKMYLAFLFSAMILYAEDIVLELPNPDAIWWVPCTRIRGYGKCSLAGF